ncbi:transglycosylase domain-containing protein [Planktosalinus lacus]|uniref:transglycosylase domain-containing protein n=1 Tax=Planktosalinus lacus TaxID=1526573 RepID=UPI00166C71A0|nr:transglycosylase domain-containing protein [Planktosalinus lacus]
MAISKRKLLKKTTFFSAAILLTLLLFYLSVLFGLWGPVPTKKQLSEINQSEASQVLASGGELLGKYFLFDRQSIPFDELPKHLVDALVATEDARFYEHNGIDGQSLFRVFFKTILLQDASSGGGSTITQQLAKNLYGRNDINKIGIVVTKLRESIIARRIEDIYSKEEIIELYFNTVPFSDNTYGVESASNKFFNKSTTDLTLAEAATLVGTLKASNYFNPRLYPKRSKQRRNLVLSQMVTYKYLHPELATNAQMDSLQLDYQYFNHNRGVATYFRETVRKKVSAILDTLRDENGKPYNLYNDGLIIHTTLDFKMQQYAEEAMLLHISKLQQSFENSWGNQAPWIKNKSLIQAQVKKLPVYKKLLKKGFTVNQIMDSLNLKTTKEFYTHDSIVKMQASVIDSIQHYMKFLNTGMISIEPATGAIKTWIGGIDYNAFQYDHVTQSKRQVGSVFKPIVYTAALENGIDACSYFSKETITYEGGYTPQNTTSSDDEDPYLNYSLKYALSNSVNTIAVQLHMETGIENVIAQAEKMGISSPLPKVPSLALGTAELSVLEIVKAYTAYTNDGFVSEPIFISRIETKEGKTIATFDSSNSEEKAFTDDTRHLMIDMMEATVNSGTAKRLRSTYGLQNDIAGKTGTTQDNKDAWFVALTPKLTTVVWVGNDLNIPFRSTSLGQGANAALPMFAQFYQSINRDGNYRNITNARFESLPEHLQAQSECEDTKRDGFFKRLFTNPDKPKEFKEKKKKGGLFSIFKRKDSN